ncbi:branched chain amino acid ABC transporter ATPase [Klebsiella pneumoniae]|uniref:Branched chain amino acid ABC transporter ATPase n=1 Tax=Klebsiella pneumoniae TaxID=573 RepID=A0A377WAG7_KLEPN|nr:branched chain amino acid ABC transporter ATPase [Klebsiella pneumoniae]
MGAYNNLAGYARLRDRMYALFPRLKERAIRWRAP